MVLIWKIRRRELRLEMPIEISCVELGTPGERCRQRGPSAGWRSAEAETPRFCSQTGLSRRAAGTAAVTASFQAVYFLLNRHSKEFVAATAALWFVLGTKRKTDQNGDGDVFHKRNQC